MNLHKELSPDIAKNKYERLYITFINKILYPTLNNQLFTQEFYECDIKDAFNAQQMYDRLSKNIAENRVTTYQELEEELELLICDIRQTPLKKYNNIMLLTGEAWSRDILDNRIKYQFLTDFRNHFETNPIQELLIDFLENVEDYDTQFLDSLESIYPFTIRESMSPYHTEDVDKHTHIQLLWT